MATLPTVGGDYNTHGTELNEYLLVGHQTGGTHFGAWASKSNNTAYEAATDGIVCAFSTSTGTVTGLTDGSNPPTTERKRNEGINAGVDFPVRKGDYWKVTGAETVNWLPIGT